MPKYTITARIVITQTATIEHFTAADEDEAAEKALSLLNLNENMGTTGQTFAQSLTWELDDEEYDIDEVTEE